MTSSEAFRGLFQQCCHTLIGTLFSTSDGQTGMSGMELRLRRSPRRKTALALAMLATLWLGGCATAPMTRGGSLSSYDSMTPSDGVLTKSLVQVSKDEVLAAKTLRLEPTAFAATASPALTDKQRALVANAIDRSLCTGLSDRFEVVLPGEPADLTVHAVVTQAAATDEIVAGASKVVSVVPAALGVPVPVPRLPVGLGSLTVEAEAVDRTGRQQGAMLWARGADSFTTSAMMSKAGDAYDLAASFGSDMSRLLVTGASPFGRLPSAPSLQKIGSSLGGKPKYAACETFGRGPGVPGLIAARIGLPPEWSDDGAPATRTP
jgi:hypothetical protein